MWRRSGEQIRPPLGEMGHHQGEAMGTLVWGGVMENDHRGGSCTERKDEEGGVEG